MFYNYNGKQKKKAVIGLEVLTAVAMTNVFIFSVKE
jgi:hypothetical protein